MTTTLRYQFLASRTKYQRALAQAIFPVVIFPGVIVSALFYFLTPVLVGTTHEG